MILYELFFSVVFHCSRRKLRYAILFFPVFRPSRLKTYYTLSSLGTAASRYVEYTTRDRHISRACARVCVSVHLRIALTQIQWNNIMTRTSVRVCNNNRNNYYYYRVIVRDIRRAYI